MKLKQLRLSRKLTISKLGQTLGIDSGNLSKIEQGKIKPSIKVLHKYSDFFNISVDELLGKSSHDFITFFRSAAPYIHSYRNKIFVIAFDGFAVDSEEFTNLCTDINLLHALGIKIVLVHGIRPFIDQRLSLGKINSKFHKNQRITTTSMMPHVIETNGLVRTKIEAALSSNIYHNNIFKSELKISSGNFLMARPIGVIDGVDMEHTGLIREINHEAILEKLDHNEIVMISPIGYSPIGEIFNLSYESSASMIAAGLKAEKLIFYTENNGLRN
ncbi:MAG: amino-acid N-acetyltransferase, partial [Methylophilaceae bacterium]